MSSVSRLCSCAKIRQYMALTIFLFCVKYFLFIHLGGVKIKRTTFKATNKKIYSHRLQISILYLFSLIGTFIVELLQIKFPGSIVGLLLLLALMI